MAISVHRKVDGTELGLQTASLTLDLRLSSRSREATAATATAPGSVLRGLQATAPMCAGLSENRVETLPAEQDPADFAVTAGEIGRFLAAHATYIGTTAP